MAHLQESVVEVNRNITGLVTEDVAGHLHKRVPDGGAPAALGGGTLLSRAAGGTQVSRHRSVSST